MSCSTDPGFRDLASSLAPSAVSRYLALHGWEFEARSEGVKEIWRLPGQAGERARGRILLPLDTGFVDFRQRFYDALLAIGLLNDWDAAKVYEQIVTTRADRFQVRLDQYMTDGTIPFRQAEATIAGIYRMLRAAATTVSSPRHPHVGRRPAAVGEFFDDDVRLGHTKAGSFIFTVVARHQDLPAQEELPVPGPRPSGDSFSRRVMETLATGLETTRDLTAGRRMDALDEPTRWGLSSALVESLEDIARPEVLRAVDLSFDWADSVAPPAVGREPIRIERTAVAGLAGVRERLARQEDPPRRETLIGSVRSLTREEVGDEDETGTIILSADVNGRSRNVKVVLDGEAHEWAILAYRKKQPLVVTGDLVHERRSWWLTGEIELDTSFLAYRYGDDPTQVD